MDGISPRKFSREPVIDPYCGRPERRALQFRGYDLLFLPRVEYIHPRDDAAVPSRAARKRNKSSRSHP